MGETATQANTTAIDHANPPCWHDTVVSNSRLFECGIIWTYDA